MAMSKTQAIRECTGYISICGRGTSWQVFGPYRVDNLRGPSTSINADSYRKAQRIAVQWRAEVALQLMDRADDAAIAAVAMQEQFRESTTLAEYIAAGVAAYGTDRLLTPAELEADALHCAQIDAQQDAVYRQQMAREMAEADAAYREQQRRQAEAEAAAAAAAETAWQAQQQATALAVAAERATIDQRQAAREIARSMRRDWRRAGC